MPYTDFKTLKERFTIEKVAELLSEFAIASQAIHIEVTETTLVEDFAAAAERMEELRQLGIVFAIDDFGTGYSSLAYLQRLPVNYLKIDRAFIKEIDTGGDAAAIVDGIVRLAHDLRLQVIAEGAETSTQDSPAAIVRM